MALADKPSAAGHRPMIAFWCAEWAARHEGERYPFNGGKDARAIQALRAIIRNDDNLRTLIVAYLNLDEAWIVERGHSLAILRVSLPQVMEAVRRSRQPAPVAKRLRGLAEWVASET